jgi:16S rRNA C967 or C1407 C5-methylase (RsmB/RsmF family)/NOL1/NOP2/fmu family ribosome biogenesis protein
MASFEQHSDRCIRLHAARSNWLTPAAIHSVPWYAYGRWLDDQSTRPSQHLGFAAADYYIQDAGSLLALALLDIQPHQSICDLCAAPGGKASGILERLGEHGFLLANEPIQSRFETLYWSLARTGNPRFALTRSDPQDLVSDFEGEFDSVLVDAPCSGQTLVSKGKRDKNAFSMSQVEHSALRQRRILESAIRMLRPGGRLVYSTCTFATLENEAHIEWLMKQYPDCWEPIEHTILEPWKSPLQAGCYRLWPDVDHCAGAFAAALRLTQPLPLAPTSLSKHVKSKPTESSSRPLVEARTFDSLGRLDGLCLKQAGNSVSAIAEDVASWWITQRRIPPHWPHIATWHKQSLIPEYALGCMNPKWFRAHKTLSLSDDQAKQLMRGEAIASMISEAMLEIRDKADRLADESSSWVLGVWQERPLGWLKHVGQRYNNYLPKYARISIGS